MGGHILDPNTNWLQIGKGYKKANRDAWKKTKWGSHNKQKKLGKNLEDENFKKNYIKKLDIKFEEYLEKIDKFLKKYNINLISIDDRVNKYIELNPDIDSSLRCSGNTAARTVVLYLGRKRLIKSFIKQK